MASKFGLAGGIPERRVRPIWDAIDSRQFKNALKHATTLLSKYPNSPYALALKALILERMGKCDEALSICLNAKELLYKNESLLMDDLTLSTLQIVFQRLEHLDLATSCYEHACAKFPNNLELMMGLFNCYVREYSFVKQQQTAIKMYKLVGEEKFLLWAVCSIQLQVLCGNGGEKLLLLAEGLLKKHAVSHSLHEPEALIVYISILEQQAKYGDALDLISGKLGSLLMIEVDKLRMQGKLLARAGDYAAALTVYQKIIELCPDDWEAFLHYLGCLFEDESSWSSGTANDPIHPPITVECKLSHLMEEIFEARVSDAQTFVESLRADPENSYLRCSYIAILEIERRKHVFGKNNYDGIIKALLEYYTRFGHMACFSSDVEVFLQVLSTDKKVEFSERLMKSSNSCAETPTKALGYSITVFKIQELIGSMNDFSVAELESSALQMVELYCKNLPLSKDLDPQESVVGEELISFVCNILVHLFWRTRFPGYLIEAIMVLEFGLSIRKYDWQYKVLLVHLYSHVGTVSLAYDWYKSLDVKNILMETVSHHILPQMLASPLWTDLNNLLKEYLRFMDEHLRESADLTFLAYRHRNYSKVIEFVQFKERLQRSNQYLVAKIESSVLQLKQNADDIEVQENTLESMKFGVHFVELSNEIGSKSMTFHEDFQSRPWWTPVPERNYLLGPFEGISYYPKENSAKEREANVRRAVERRSLLPRMVYLSIQSASSPLKENTEMNGSSSDSKISLEFKSLLDCMAKMLGYSLSDAINKVMAASRELQVSKPFDSNTVDWLNFAVFLNAWNCGSREVLQQDAECWRIVNSLLERCILDKMRLMEPLICSPGHDLPELVQLVSEPFAWHCLVISSSVRSCHPVGKKKKKSGLTDQSSYLISHAIRDAIHLSSRLMENVTRWLKELINRPEDELMDTILSSIKGSAENGPGQVLQTLETFRSSINELEHGHRIAEASRSWHHADVARKMVTGQCIVLSEFLRICESKIKMLDAMKQQIAQL